MYMDNYHRTILLPTVVIIAPTIGANLGPLFGPWIFSPGFNPGFSSKISQLKTWGAATPKLSVTHPRFCSGTIPSQLAPT